MIYAFPFDVEEATDGLRMELTDLYSDKEITSSLP